jgi:hypothetical protein
VRDLRGILNQTSGIDKSMQMIDDDTDSRKIKSKSLNGALPCIDTTVTPVCLPPSRGTTVVGAKKKGSENSFKNSFFKARCYSFQFFFSKPHRLILQIK